MNKKIINDIVPKKSIRQIPISAEKESRTKKTAEHNHENHAHIPQHITTRSPNWKRKPLNPRFVIWLIAIICLLSLFFGISIIFSSTTVIITPKTEKITFNNDTYIAKINSSSTTDLSYEILSVKQTFGETVEATIEKDVNQKASGTIVIYNNFSSASQRLINNTRFEADNGKIYRIVNSVTVPGIKTVDGKSTPGSIEATVNADQPGESYNLKLSDLMGDFKIPGFKGDLRYNSFYARLKTDIIGGLTGKQKIIGDDVRKAAEDSIKKQLKEQLLNQLYAILPKNYLFFPNGYSVDYVNQPDTALEDNKVKINLEGDLNGIVFNSLKLSKYIATKKIDNFDGLPVKLVPLNNFVATLTGADSTGLWKNSSLQVKLVGDANIQWLYDGDALKRDLAGKKESDLKNIISKYQDSISTIQVLFRPTWTPFWMRYVPDNLNKIIIKESTS